MPKIDDTPTFNLKAVIQETGLRPDTLRAWERRYNLPQPGRSVGGHRLYSQRDIDILKWLIARQDEGMSIGRAADLWHRLEAEGQDPLQTAETAAPPPAPSPLAFGYAIDDLRRAWINACLAFDEQGAEHILGQASSFYPLEQVCFDLLQQGLVHMGDGWYKGEVSVQQEHFASALALRWLEALMVATPTPARPERVLVGCPPDEEHTFSLHVITLLLRRHGWKALYLGANVPLVKMETTIAAARPQLVVLSAQLLPTAATLLEMARLLQREHIPLAFGGSIFNHIPALRRRIPGHFLGERLDKVPAVIEQLLLAPRPVPAAELPSPAYQQALVHYRERRAMIEAATWTALRGEDIPQRHLANANQQMGDHIAAALALGDIDFLGTTITWLEGLLVNYDLPANQLYRYMASYHEASRAHLDERGQPVVAWLAELVGQSERKQPPAGGRGQDEIPASF